MSVTDHGGNFWKGCAVPDRNAFPSRAAELHERAKEIANLRCAHYFLDCGCDSCKAARADAVLEVGMDDSADWERECEGRGA